VIHIRRRQKMEGSTPDEACRVPLMNALKDETTEEMGCPDIDAFGPDFLSKVGIDASKAQHANGMKASSSSLTTEETISDSASVYSINERDISQNNSHDIECDLSVQSTMSTNSAESNSSMDSTQLLLKQAQARLHRQSIYEEVQHLRTLVAGHETHSKLLSRQKSTLLIKYTELESAHKAALEQIHDHKISLHQTAELQSERELEYINSLNSVCKIHEEKEQDYMGQLIEKDEKIFQLQNKLNELETQNRRLRLRLEGNEVGDLVSAMEIRERLGDDEESSVEYC
jgi:hypothetical protein